MQGKKQGIEYPFYLTWPVKAVHLPAIQERLCTHMHGVFLHLHPLSGSRLTKVKTGCATNRKANSKMTVMCIEKFPMKRDLAKRPLE